MFGKTEYIRPHYHGNKTFSDLNASRLVSVPRGPVHLNYSICFFRCRAVKVAIMASDHSPGLCTEVTGASSPTSARGKSGKILAVRVQMLDDSVTLFQIQVMRI
jgi:hypothetical protein